MAPPSRPDDVHRTDPLPAGAGTPAAAARRTAGATATMPVAATVAAMIAAMVAFLPARAVAGVDDAVASVDAADAPRLHLSSERRAGVDAGAADRRETVLWAGSDDGVSVGLGVARDDVPRAAAAPARMIVGVALGTGARSTLTVQSSWSAPAGDAATPVARDGLRAGAPEVRVGWQLRSADRASAFKGGALRLELGSQTALLVKPRIGRVGMLLTSRW